MWLHSRSRVAKSHKPTVVQYMSDLHLEQVDYQWSINPAASILLLVGDIGRFYDFDRYRAFIMQCCDHFSKVLLVGGNHEYYGTSHEKGLQLVKDITNDPATKGKVIYLHRTTYDVPNSNITIAGCTLHSHIGEDRLSLTNDFRRIEGWTVDKHNLEHATDLAWLKSQLALVGEKRRIIIATHYAPTLKKTCHPMHKGSKLNQCFASNAFDELQRSPGARNVTHWVYGHTHWNTKFRRGKTLLISNQRCNDFGKLNWWQRKFLYRPFNMNAVIKV
jgi:predicted phosphodiesterase